MKRLALCTALLVFIACREQPGSTLAIHAAEGKAEVVRQMIGAGADPNGTDESGWSPLVWSARQGALESALALIEGGADVDLEDHRNGWTPLLHSIHKGHPGMVALLLDNGADPNRPSRDSGMTPLVMAAGYGQDDIVTLLLEGGADPHQSATSGWTPLDAAVFGAADIDRFTIGHCQDDAVRAIVERAPEARITNRIAVIPARAAGCDEVLDLVRSRLRG